MQKEMGIEGMVSSEMQQQEMQLNIQNIGYDTNG